MISSLILFFALIFLMLVTGIFWGPWFALHRSLHVFNEGEFIHIVKTLAGNLAIPMRILMPICILFLALSVWIYPERGTLGWYLIWLASGFTIISLLITLVVEVPLVNQFLQWTTTNIPSNWKSIRDRWIKFHVIRTISSIVSFACLLAAILSLIEY